VKKRAETLDATVDLHDDSSDSDDNKASDAQGILGKGMHQFDADEDTLEESEGSIYHIKSGRESMEMKLSMIRDYNMSNTINGIDTIEEDEKEEDKEDEDKKSGESDRENSLSSSESRESDYLTEEDEEEKDLVPVAKNLEDIKGKYTNAFSYRIYLNNIYLVLI